MLITKKSLQSSAFNNFVTTKTKQTENKIHCSAKTDRECFVLEAGRWISEISVLQSALQVNLH